MYNLGSIFGNQISIWLFGNQFFDILFENQISNQLIGS